MKPGDWAFTASVQQTRVPFEYVCYVLHLLPQRNAYVVFPDDPNGNEREFVVPISTLAVVDDPDWVLIDSNRFPYGTEPVSGQYYHERWIGTSSVGGAARDRYPVRVLAVDAAKRQLPILRPGVFTPK